MHKFLKGPLFVLILTVALVSLTACKAQVVNGKITYKLGVSDFSSSTTSPTTTPSPSTTPSTTPEETEESSSSPTTKETTPTEEIPLPDDLNLEHVAEKGVQKILDGTGFTGDVLGRASRPGNPTSDHPKGLAADFMTDSRSMGDRIANYARENAGRLHVKYVLWQVKDHFDHVHVSFEED